MVIFSSLEPMREEVTEKLPKLEGGRIIPHFESKAEVAVSEEHFHQMPCTGTLLIGSACAYLSPALGGLRTTQGCAFVHLRAAQKSV